ncbi:PKD domain-containing protein [Motilimonas eburnea]|uniref:PKD domain-containing protein n=1 Tax=Motilimonas eburnea TaxID=1737488 RepID=UPI001E3953C4|nr:PKD domain-containing protein [Motilimonas eburnea]MCE2573260.1 PKD domain-containing protein [Motilimonas eburnea]
MQRRTKHTIGTLCLSAMLGFGAYANAAPNQVRVVWDQDPARNAVIGFSPSQTSANSYVMYGQNPDEATWRKLTPFASRRFDSVLTSEFVRVRNLTPDEHVYFRLCDEQGCGQHYTFKTAPSAPADFTFVAGGDSRSNASMRRTGNKLVSKVRPLFVMFGGDLTYGNEAHEVSQWLSDWQSTFSQDQVNGVNYLSIPALVPTVGNHEGNDHTFICKVFGVDGDNNGRCDLNDTYFAFNVGGDQMRVYTLNTEFRSSGYQTQWQQQKNWLSNDLSQAGGQVQWRISQYHKPMFPRTTSKSYVNTKMFEWAGDFYNKKMNLAVESDSHLVKYSWPVKPASNDMEQVSAGTVFIGEGSWGAPTRPADRYSSWIADQSSFAQFKIIQLKGEQMLIRTARFSSSGQALSQQARAQDPLALPTGLSLWQADQIGDTYRLGLDNAGRTVVVDDNPPSPLFDASCDGLSCRFDASASVGAGLNYLWQFGDQQQGSGAIVNHTFANAGEYQVRLTVTNGSGQSEQLTKKVVVTATPNQGIELVNNQTKTNLSGRKGQDTLYVFDNKTVGRLTITTQGGTGDVDLLVKFGSRPSGSNADCRPYKNGNNEECVIDNAAIGRFYIVLNGYQDYQGVSLKVSAATGSENQAPVASFKAQVQGLSIELTDLSTDADSNIVSWLWQLGDGTQLDATDGQAVKHTYQKAGQYTVSLKVTDQQGASHRVTKDVNVTEPGQAEAWNSSKVYVEGDKVLYQGKVYSAQWWNKGVEPGASQWGPWQLVDGAVQPSVEPTIAPTPTPTVVPTTSPTIAPTVTPTMTPTAEPGTGCQGSSWDAAQSYVPGDQVVYANKRWQATWYSTALAPGSSNAWSSWEVIGECN